ncbi:MAG: dephospho-CoA kinase [Gammaproteobacteria bacterium]|nr:dephospho-CoA kinase [Gammaproteobacteria bacterium]MCH9744750.1 dephospho-CoA kinase [Gammaproteobacteria bacterium]
MLVVGLTGGIGAGKSTVMQLFAKHNVPTLDADATAHQLSKPGEAGYDAIVKHFGASLLKENKEINRKKLRQLIFNDESERQWLEKTLHPMILHQIRTELEELEKTNMPYCIIDIPLIRTRHQFEFLDRILVIDCTVELQISRTQQRDHIDEQSIRNIMSHQCSREQRLKLADDIMSNEGPLEVLTRSVDKLHNQYQNLASKQH